jgi:hypothetical protein
VELLSSEEEKWMPFILWPYQSQLLKTLETDFRILILKARQLGFTTIVIAYLVWRMLFHSVATIGLFSRGEIEAMDLLERLTKTYHRLPPWLRAERVVANNAHYFELSNGSWARAMSTNKGESFTFKYLFLDELDRFPNAATLLKNVKPAADSAKAQIIAGSISDKDDMDTPFKNMVAATMEGQGEWNLIFLPCFDRPGRDDGWYDRIFSEILIRMKGDEAGAKDEMFQQYPRTIEEALAPRKQGKRIPFAHLQIVYEKEDPIQDHPGPAIPDLKVYRLPQPNRSYVIGGDPAEGVEGGSDSSICVMDKGSGEEVAALQGKFEPKKVFPKMLFQIAVWYNFAEILPERNNHGHAVIGELNELIAADFSVRAAQVTEILTKEASAVGQGDVIVADSLEIPRVWILNDPNDKKEGWLTSPSGSAVTRGKVAMYDNGAQAVKDELVIIHDPVTLDQLSSIDINNLKNLNGHDDAADAFVLAETARRIPGRTLKGQLFF